MFEYFSRSSDNDSISFILSTLEITHMGIKFTLYNSYWVFEKPSTTVIKIRCNTPATSTHHIIHMLSSNTCLDRLFMLLMVLFMVSSMISMLDSCYQRYRNIAKEIKSTNCLSNNNYDLGDLNKIIKDKDYILFKVLWTRFLG